MPFDYDKLRGKIREVFGSQEKFAKAMNIGYVTLSTKLNNYAEWKQNEILKACELLKIDLEEIPIYFFTLKVQEVEQK